LEKFLKVLTLCLLIGPAQAQMPIGEFRARFNPPSKVIKAGDSISLETGIFSVSGSSSWNSVYDIQRKSISAPDTFLVLVRSTYFYTGAISLAADYYGPYLSIKGENPGFYIIRFDSTSQFKVDMADTVTFTALSPNGIRSIPTHLADGIAKHRYQVDGRKFIKREANPVFAW
jgi:hypothetical protein